MGNWSRPKLVFTWGPGKPPMGHPRGHLTSFCNSVYSCSIPYLLYLFLQKCSIKTSKTKKLNKTKTQLPWLFSYYIRMPEDLRRPMPLVRRNRLSGWCVWITYHLIKVDNNISLIIITTPISLIGYTSTYH